MKKATHKGHCQVCGSLQMLPGGVLSKHGYTTRWGFFSGVCTGAGHLPFEQDISLIAAAIKSAMAQAVSLRTSAAARRVISDLADVIVNTYQPASGRDRGGYVDYTGRIESRNNRAWFVYERMGHECEYDLHDWADVERLPKLALEHNGRAASKLEILAEQADDYVKWQRRRIKGWRPSQPFPRQAEVLAHHV